MVSLSRRPTSIEPLEARIAPALLINGANLLGGDGPSTGETSVGDHSVEVVKVLSGQAIVWFQDGTILGISIAPNTSLEITGDLGVDTSNGRIGGDIIANLLPTGRLSDSDNDPSNGEDGMVLLPNNLIGLKTFPLGGHQGSLGSVITGGAVSNLKISGEISGIYAGDGAFRDESVVATGKVVYSSLGLLDFNPIQEGIQNYFELPLAKAQPNAATGTKGLLPGASIQNVEIAKARELQVFAGSGNPNDLSVTGRALSGGSIHDITLDNAFSNAVSISGTASPSYHLLAGDGGNGGSGGAGGSISNIVEKASSGSVVIQAGHGGLGANGAGGAGGSITNLDLQSDSSQYLVRGGDGGNGTPGGAGGSLKNNNFANRTPVGGVIVAADFTGDGIDDVLVADQGTGQMVLSENLGDGLGFSQVLQTVKDGKQVFQIAGKGVTPSDAAAVDFNGDGKLDLVVAYKNSNQIAVYLNQGGGVFWDGSLAEGEGDFAGFTTSLGLSPTKLAISGHTGNQIAVAGNVEGKGAVQLLSREASGEGPTLTVEEGVNKFPVPVADIVSTTGGFFAALGDGTIHALSQSDGGKQPFVDTPTGRKLAGGIADLDVDSAGDRLIALGAGNKVMQIFDVTSSASAGALSDPIEIKLTTGVGTPVVVQFIDDNLPDTEDRIAVLSSLGSGARIDLFDPTISSVDGAVAYSFSRSIQTTQALKTFVPAYDHPNDNQQPLAGPPGFAALSSSLSQFTFSDDLVNVAEYSLPFATKEVNAAAGHGGKGLDIGARLGKGGIGGSIIGLNADAVKITLTGGDGGDSEKGMAGAGGSISNPSSFKSASGLSIAPQLLGDANINIYAGNGGSALIAGERGASGGAGGSISSLALKLGHGTGVRLEAGDGGDSRGGVAGAGGSINAITSLAMGGDFAAIAGHGGAALAGTSGGSGAAGAGGSITKLNHELQLDDDAETDERTFDVLLEAGHGGNAISGAGGAGGNLTTLQLKLDGANRTYLDEGAKPALSDSENPSTITVQVLAGNGGEGSKGGMGGTIKDLQYDSVYDQVFRDQSVAINYVVMNLRAGDGGRGLTADGGTGGSILLSKPISGVTAFDPDSPTPEDNPNRVPLIVRAGDAGDGATNGGAGGSINGLIAQNGQFAGGADISTTHLVGAIITAGDGGDGAKGNGGKGGSITNTLVGVQSQSLRYGFESKHWRYSDNPIGGLLEVHAGNGGAGSGSDKAKGGAGGVVNANEFGVVSSVENLGMLVTGGNGGAGVLAGGTGGAISNLKLNASQSTAEPGALVIAGAGGDARFAAGTGGKGGDVTGISQTKDINSSINLIQAGNGGDNPLGKAGAGGSVSAIRTAGFIGRPTSVSYVSTEEGLEVVSTPLGIFDQITVDDGGISVPTGLFHDNGDGTVEFAQGLFVGRGGAGVTNGVNGSVSNVVARQIAAIAAAMDPTTELFAAVAKISKVKTDLLGYDADRGLNNAGSGHFNDITGGTASPITVKPRDGFLLTSAPVSPAQNVVITLKRDEFLLS